MSDRALVLAPRFPLPLHSGTQVREYHLLSGIARRYDTTLLSLVQDPPVEAAARRLREDLGVEVRTVVGGRSKSVAAGLTLVTGRPYRTNKFTVPPFRDAVDEALSEEFDLVWANFLNTVAALPSDPDPTVVLDEHNADVRYWQSFADGGPVDRLFARWNVALLRRLRPRLADRIDALVSVSEADAEAGREWVGETPVHVVPNGVDTDRYAPDGPAGATADRVLFVGSLGVRMNEEAVEWFVREAWPAIRERRPAARFDVVGRSPGQRLRQVADAPGVDLVGPVDSVRPNYEDAGVVVVPSAYGGGSKLKVLEALAMGRPVVATPEGIVGVGDLADEGVIVRERGAGFGDAVADLLADPDRRTELGRRGRAYVRDHYDWDALVEDGLARVLGAPVSQ